VKLGARICVTQPLDPTEVERRKATNVRTALTFASIAATFFVGIIAARILGGPMIGIGVMSVAVLLFLVFAIGRSLRMSEAGESRGRLGEQGEAEARRAGLRALAVADPGAQRRPDSVAEAAAKGASPSDCGGRPLGLFDPPLSVRRPRE
jgi:hypothetical protein